MKIKNPFLIGIMLFCILGTFQLSAQLVDDVSITAKEANLQMIAPNSYFIEIAGPANYYWKEEVAHTNNISISNVNSKGEKFKDGSYMMQVTPIVKLTDTERAELQKLSAENDQEKLAAYRLEHSLPENIDVYNIYFSIRNGEFVTPEQKENKSLKLPTMSSTWQQDHPVLYASLNPVEVNYGMNTSIKGLAPTGDNSLAEDDQVFFDDVIVVGSICVGQDCANGENFGFDTGRYKENNLRVHFDDTSNSSSFPKNDWRITINDSSNGGANYFAIEDATAGRVPFRIIAGAPANSLYVDAQGDIGIGTASPVLELHINDGDTPTMRLQQDGSSGFGQQTWDIAGNETNFFVRDVSNSSQLPFKIFPGADDNSLVIDADNNIGMGVQNPTHKLQIETGNVWVKSGRVGVNVEPGAFDLEVVGNTQFSGNVIFKDGDPNFFLTNGISFLNANFLTAMRIDAPNRRVGIAVNGSPSYELEVCGTIATTAAMVTTGITCSSDARFKTNVQTLESSLDKLMKLRGVTYNWKVNEYPDKGFNNDLQIGFIAQEIEELYPQLVKTDVKGFRTVDYSKTTPILVEAIKEQQEIINAQQEEIAELQKEVNELNELKAQVAALTGMVSALNKVEEGEASSENVGDE